MNFAEQFPLLDHCTYLNTASSGILSHALLQWRQTHDLEFAEQGSNFRLQQATFLQNVRHNIARIFQAKEENTFLVPNFSFGFNTLLDQLSPHHRILLLKGEYPSVYFPVETREFTVDHALIDEHMEENILEKIKTFQPTILVISLVQYVSGIKVDLDRIKEIKSRYPELLIVADGTQFCGTEKFDFSASGVDVLIASGYKWMLGGYGNGFLLIKDTLAPHFYRKKANQVLPNEPFLKEKTSLSLCFEPGHLDTLNFGSLNQSALFLEELGFDFIENRIKTLSQLAKEAFGSRGLLAPAVVQRKEHSSIFNLSADPILAASIETANIIFSSRGPGIRVSFHYYSTETDLNRLLQVIDRHGM